MIRMNKEYLLDMEKNGNPAWGCVKVIALVRAGCKEPPEFTDREDGIVPSTPPADLDEWRGMMEKTEAEWLAMGMIQWDAHLFCFPKEWYDAIPVGMPVHTVNGYTKPFERDPSSAVYMWGGLGYGMLYCSEEKIDGLLKEAGVTREEAERMLTAESLIDGVLGGCDDQVAH